jgi:peptidoglycan/LPS O-acetylase OafA/YrhL
MDRVRRRCDLDWLLLAATGCVFVFHCARFFSTEDWHVKNVVLYPGMTTFTRMLGVWLMPLFFLLSGMSVHAQLSGQTEAGRAGRFLRARALRLGLPFVFGVLVLNAPAQVWLERLSNGAFQGSLWAFYPHYFEGFYAFGGNFAWMGLHLWYLAMLLLFSLLCTPAFVAVLRAGPAPDRGPAARVALSVLGYSALLLVELAVSLDPRGAGIRVFGGWSPCTYLAIFCLGFLLEREPWSREALVRRGWPLLLLAVAAEAAMWHVPLGSVSWLALRTAAAWLALLAALGLAARWLDIPSPALRPLREAALPFYILHQPVIVATGFVLADWQTPLWLKYLCLAVIAFCITSALTAAVLHSGPLRPLFGLRRD